MTYEEKLNILKEVLKQNGLSYEDEEIFGFFNEERATQPELFDENDELHDYSEHIACVIKKVNPLDFENALYAYDHKLNTLLDWFLYENAGENPFVWNNIGNSKFDIKKSFVQARYKEPAKIDLTGRLFNGGDGNHRLATLIINCIIEFAKAKTEEDKKLILEKYSMEIPVKIPFKHFLCSLLNEQWLKCSSVTSDSIYPQEVREFRESTFATKEESRCFVKYDEKTKTLSYDFNGEKIVGTEEDLIDCLYGKKDSVEPIMQWYGGGYYYLSCNNKVFKSKNREEVENMLPMVQVGYEKGEFDLYNFVEVKDLDTNTYEIVVSQEYIQDKNQAVAVANKVQNLLINNLNDEVWNKLDDGIMWKSDLIERVKYESIHFNGFTMPQLCFKNLTKQEYKQLKDVVYEITATIKFLKDDAYEI